MAYYNLETPRIFTDIGLYAKMNGFLDTSLSTPGYFNLDPTIHKNYELEGELITHVTRLRFINGYEQLASGVQAVFYLGAKGDSYNAMLPDAATSIFPDTHGNYNVTTTEFGWGYNASENFDPYSLVSVEGIMGTNGIDFAAIFQGEDGSGIPSKYLNEISACAMYEFQHSADFDMVLTQSNESINTIETKSGKTFINQGWSSPPMWGKLAPWQICGSKSNLGSFDAMADKKGFSNTFRRSWTINFSYVDKNTTTKGLYPENYSNKHGILDTIVDGDTITYNGIKNDFTNKVINLTNGFALPVIFQPDKNVQEFAICKIETENFSATCVSPGFFDVSLTLREIW